MEIMTMNYLNLYVLTKQDFDLGWIRKDGADRKIPWTNNNQEIQTLVVWSPLIKKF